MVCFNPICSAAPSSSQREETAGLRTFSWSVTSSWREIRRLPRSPARQVDALAGGASATASGWEHAAEALADLVEGDLRRPC